MIIITVRSLAVNDEDIAIIYCPVVPRVGEILILKNRYKVDQVAYGFDYNGNLYETYLLVTKL